MDIGELLEYLDGRGLVVTDDDLLVEALDECGVTLRTAIPTRADIQACDVEESEG